MKEIEKLLEDDDNNAAAQLNRYLLNNQIYPKRSVNPMLGALHLYVNQLKCPLTFKQHMWADERIADAYPFPTAITPSITTEILRKLNDLDHRFTAHNHIRVELALKLLECKKSATTYRSIHSDTDKIIKQGQFLEMLSRKNKIVMRPSATDPGIFLPSLEN